MQGIRPFPNNKSTKTVISLTSETSRTVQVLANGKIACDKNFPSFKQFSMCAHTIAVASQTGKLVDFVWSDEPPLEQMVSSIIPSGSGKTDSERSRRRVRKDHLRGMSGSTKKESSLVARREWRKKKHPTSWFLWKTSATTYYGCKGRVRDKPSLPPLPPIWHLHTTSHEKSL